jgi:hypothetical protein
MLSRMGNTSHPPVIALILALGAGALAVQCGARTPLDEPSQDKADAAVPDAPTADAEASVVVDASPESSPETGPDAVIPDATVASCHLAQGSEPIEIYTLADQDLHTPSMVVLNPGEPLGGPLARVALQAVANGIRLVSMTVPEPGTPGIELDKEPIFVGAGATYGHMTHAPGGLAQLALVWGADGPGNLFRTVDIPSWSLGPLVQVSPVGWTPTGLAAGKGIPNTQSGQYEGDGYGMAWQRGTGQAPFVAVLNAAGEVQAGPLSPSAGVPGDFLESSIAWSGSTYLIATRFEKCTAGDPLCKQRSVVVTRFRVAPGSNSIELASSFQPGTAGWLPGYPTLDGVTMVWHERPESGDEARIVHVQALEQDGAPAGPDHVVNSNTHPLARPFIGSTPAGKVVGWAEEGEKSLSDDAFGRSVLWLQTFKPDLAFDDAAPVGLKISRYGSMGAPAVVPLENPRGVLVAWSARSMSSPRNAVFAQFLRCVE